LTSAYSQNNSVTVKDVLNSDYTLLPTVHAYNKICDKSVRFFGLNGSQLTSMCEVVIHSELCSEIDSDKLMNCENVESPSYIGRTFDSIFGCIKGVGKGVVTFPH